MNKAELIEAVAGSASLSKADAGRAVDAVVDAVTSALRKGQQVSVVGFGTFSVKHRAARTGRNPRTGEAINIPASNVPANGCDDPDCGKQCARVQGWQGIEGCRKLTGPVPGGA